MSIIEESASKSRSLSESEIDSVVDTFRNLLKEYSVSGDEADLRRFAAAHPAAGEILENNVFSRNPIKTGIGIGAGLGAAAIGADFLPGLDGPEYAADDFSEPPVDFNDSFGPPADEPSIFDRWFEPGSAENDFDYADAPTQFNEDEDEDQDEIDDQDDDQE